MSKEDSDDIVMFYRKPKLPEEMERVKEEVAQLLLGIEQRVSALRALGVSYLCTAYVAIPDTTGFSVFGESSFVAENIQESTIFTKKLLAVIGRMHDTTLEILFSEIEDLDEEEGPEGPEGPEGEC